MRYTAYPHPKQLRQEADAPPFNSLCAPLIWHLSSFIAVVPAREPALLLVAYLLVMHMN